ncbi:AsmA-like C-terminal region-containing protein [Primorskyibacter sp. S187A]|uniref:YhdP family protein n=1 Tax=Primorskyibacter sp. S187A TaxID=3415130 RepID=UPI003C7E43AF
MTRPKGETVTSGSEDAAPEDVDTASSDAPTKGRRRGRRVVLWMGAVVVLLAMAGAAAGWALLGRAIAAPDWVRNQIEARLDAALPQVSIDMGAITLQVDEGFNPAVSIDNVTVSDPLSGRPLVSLTRLDAEFSRRNLLSGQVRAKQVSAAGLFLQLRRGRDGAFDLSFGSGLNRSAPDMAGLLRQFDAVVEDAQLDALREVTLNAVTLEYQDAVSGRSWLIDGGRIALRRDSAMLSASSDFALLTGGAEAASVALNATSPLGSPQIAIGVTLTDIPAGDIATQSSALEWLGVLRAPISGALRTGFDETGALQPLNATLQIGQGVLQPNDAAKPVPFEAARAYFTYEPATRAFDFSEVSVRSDWVTGSGTGTATLETEGAAGLAGLTAQLRLSDVSANPFELYDAPRQIDDATMALHLALDPFVLRLGQVTAQSGDAALLAQGRVVADDEGWKVSAMAEAETATPAQVLKFWPQTALSGTRDWIARSIPEAEFRDLQFVLRAREGAKPDIYLGSSVQKATVQFLPTMPPLQDLTGRLTLEDHRLVVIADQAVVRPEEGGAIEADGTKFVLADVREKSGQAQVHLKTQSTITAALSLIDAEPLAVMQKADRPVDLAEGRADLTGLLSFALGRADGQEGISVAYDVSGALRNVRSDQIVAGREIASDLLEIDVTPTDIRIAGAGTFDGVPFEGAWQSPIGAEPATSVVEADIELSSASLAALNVDLPEGMLEGRGRGRLVVDLPPGETPSFSVSTDLTGLGLQIAPIGWALSRGAKGRLSLAGALSQPVRVDRIALDAPGLEASGRIGLQEGGGLDRLELDRVRVGGWLDGPVTLAGRGAGQPFAVAVRGGTIDLRRAPFGASGGGVSAGGGGGPLRIAVDRLQITDTLALTDFLGNFETGRGLVGPFTARINGGAEIEGQARAEDRGTGFVIRAEDAGDALRDAGLFRNLSDGRLTLRLRPTGQPGTFDGEATINEPRLRNAPAIAELLNAVSVVGLLSQLNGEGIYFQEVEARFRLSPSRVILTSSSAVGPSMGISLDGFYDIARGEMDMQGVVSPLYAVNILGRAIARKGEGLIGFNFNMTGAASDPTVSVNPFSALTPGMFRDIFRRPPPTVSE